MFLWLYVVYMGANVGMVLLISIHPSIITAQIMSHLVWDIGQGQIFSNKCIKLPGWFIPYGINHTGNFKWEISPYPLLDNGVLLIHTIRDWIKKTKWMRISLNKGGS